MIAGEAPNFSSVLELSTGMAMIAGADFDTHSYRVGYDISIPLYSPIANKHAIKTIHNER